MLAAEQKFAEEKRKKDEARIRAAEVSREKEMEEDEVETAELAVGAYRDKETEVHSFRVHYTRHVNGEWGHLARRGRVGV